MICQKCVTGRNPTCPPALSHGRLAMPIKATPTIREVTEMKYTVVFAACVMLATVGYAKKDGRSEQDEHATILEFRTMAGNSGVFIGATTPIRGINAGGAPWTFAPGGRARGELRGDGRLEIEVRGLVLADDPAVPVT